MKRNWTDRWAILVSLIILAILRFLYGRFGWGAGINTNSAATAPAVVDTVVDAGDNDAEPEIDGTIPWYNYLQENDYTNTTKLWDFWVDEVITRATATPFLARYGFVSGLEEKSTVEECTFPDVADKSEDLQNTIIVACAYDLLRGSEGNFIPNRIMTKDELLTVLVRSKTGFLAEDSEPRFLNYFNWAQTNGLVDAASTIDEFSWNVTKADLWQWLYRLSLLN